MNADLNYAIKRLIRGLTSDTHSVKRGFFLGTVLVLKRFKTQVDLPKLVEFVNEETKVASGVRGQELHSLMMGRMMCISAIIEAEFFPMSKPGQQK